MGISNQIKTLRLAADMTQAELAERLGVTRATVTQWESGWSQPRMGKVQKLAEIFNISISELVDTEKKTHSSSSDFVDVPLYGSIAAGTPIEMIEIEEAYPVAAKKIEQYPDAFLLKVKGRSMDKILPDGCYALVDPCNDVERDNQPYAVCVNGYDATVKRVRKLANGFELVPDSTDPTYKPQVYDYGVEGTETITVIGRVVYYVLPFDWEF